MFLSVGTLSVTANGQTAGALPSDVIAANRELDHQLLEGHRLLDAEKVMGLFTSSADIFFTGISSSNPPKIPNTMACGKRRTRRRCKVGSNNYLDKKNPSIRILI